MNEGQPFSFFINRRSIRSFKQKIIPDNILHNCVNSARLAPTGMNLQPLEYIIITKEKIRNIMFSFVHWAGYLSDWNPQENEQPMAYIVLIYKKNESSYYSYDVGIALAHIILYAEANDLGSCILKNIETAKIQELLKIPHTYSVDSVVALGYKNEHPVIEINDQEKKYWLDEAQVLHVPKRSLESIIHHQSF